MPCGSTEIKTGIRLPKFTNSPDNECSEENREGIHLLFLLPPSSPPKRLKTAEGQMWLVLPFPALNQATHSADKIRTRNCQERAGVTPIPAGTPFPTPPWSNHSSAEHGATAVTRAPFVFLSDIIHRSSQQTTSIRRTCALLQIAQQLQPDSPLIYSVQLVTVTLATLFPAQH